MSGLSITFNVENFPRSEREFINLSGDDFSKVTFENKGNNEITIECTCIDSSGSTKQVIYKYFANRPEPKKINHAIIRLREGDDEDFVSSSLKYIVYDANRQLLAVSFDMNSNAIYVYSPVDVMMFYNLTHSSSLGEYFNRAIKPNQNISVLKCNYDSFMEEIEELENEHRQELDEQLF